MQTTEMTDSSEIIVSSSNNNCTSRMAPSRVRIVRLIRNSGLYRLSCQTASFGFSIRGGREFGIGFFISQIESGSEADIRGLKIGDQIIRVNGYLVDDAVHKELSQYISCANRLTLRVRSVGMLPVKENCTDLLTWHIVPKDQIIERYEKTDQFHCQDIRINLNVAPRTKLGLGICKGPEWKPGVFVQFTKDIGIARETGLRPGDQIVSCNGVDFTDIQFSEAVAVMKQSPNLELVVRTGAGLNLFPGESSGYNSSASSITGDQSPCWNDQAAKRLSIVKEEDVTEKTGSNRLKYRSHNCKNRGIYVVNPSIGEESVSIVNDRESNTTIIKLSENGTEINNTSIPKIKDHSELKTTSVCLNSSDGDNQNANCHPKNKIKVKINGECNDEKSNFNNGKLADICFVSRKCSTKTVIVEVHRDESRSEGKIRCKIPPPPPIRFSHHTKSCPSKDANNVPNAVESTSLNTAISEELKRRLESVHVNGNPNNMVKSNELLNNGRSLVGGHGNEKHNALMDEFKKAHQRMFKNGFCETDSGDQLNSKERQLKLQQAKAKEQPNKVVTPDPDYDISPLNSLENVDHNNDKRRIDSEYFPSKASVEMLPKSSSAVAIKICEYADRKEPCKLNFISKFESNEGNGDVSTQLKNELEKTLSKLNFKTAKETLTGDNNKQSSSKEQENISKETPARSTSNVEKIAALLTNQHQIKHNKNDIFKPVNTFGIKKSDSVPNGILKTGSNTCSEHKNISFGKTTTTLVDNET